MRHRFSSLFAIAAAIVVAIVAWPGGALVYAQSSPSPQSELSRYISNLISIHGQVGVPGTLNADLESKFFQPLETAAADGDVNLATDLRSSLQRGIKPSQNAQLNDLIYRQLANRLRNQPATTEGDMVALQLVLLLGEIAAPQSFSPMMDALTHRDPAVRFAAANGLNVTYPNRIVAGLGPADLQTIAKVGKVETSKPTLERLYQLLRQDGRDQARAVMADILGARAARYAQGEVGLVGADVTALNFLREVYPDLSASARTPLFSAVPLMIRGAVAMYTDTGRKLSEEQRFDLLLAIEALEGIALRVANINPGSAQDPKLTAAVRQEFTASAFPRTQAAAQQWFGTARNPGLLTKTPFIAPAPASDEPATRPATRPS